VPLEIAPSRNIRRSSFLLTLCVIIILALIAGLLYYGTPEDRAARALDRIRDNPAALDAFLRRMPKGGDLHMHLTGAVYAETFIRDAAEDGLCVDPATLGFVKPPSPGKCPKPDLPAASVPSNQVLYDKLIDAFSMRGFVPMPSMDGHDQFFATFDRFEPVSNTHYGEWLAEVANRAASQNESYLEIMTTPDFSHAAALAEKIGWPSDPAVVPDFSLMRDRLLAAGLRDDVPTIRNTMTTNESNRDNLDHCGQPNATSGCTIRMRYLYQVLRGFPPEIVFAQTLLGFETVSAEMASGHARYVGINFVMPEDGVISMRDYHLQMEMLDYLHSVYPQVHISLHAGELTLGLVPPDGLRFHIREAILLGHAERIGHGVDIMQEDNPKALLLYMARHHIMVEINLTSNDTILGVTGQHHPLPEYLAADVPVALSTDDEGVSRIDLTHEYVRAVTDYNLGYLDLKQMARTSLEHSFLPGHSLWMGHDEYAMIVPFCRPMGIGHHAGDSNISPDCANFLAHNEKAAAQWDLESRFRKFELNVNRNPRMTRWGTLLPDSQ
jgi:adenosine deaminase